MSLTCKCYVGIFFREIQDEEAQNHSLIQTRRWVGSEVGFSQRPQGHTLSWCLCFFFHTAGSVSLLTGLFIPPAGTWPSGQPCWAELSRTFQLWNALPTNSVSWVSTLKLLWEDYKWTTSTCQYWTTVGFSWNGSELLWSRVWMHGSKELQADHTV